MKPDYSRQTNQRNTGTSIAYGQTREQYNQEKKPHDDNWSIARNVLNDMENFSNRFKVKFPTL